MSRNQIGFTLFMSLLLIAPKIPLRIPGGAERSSVSLGIVGLVVWYLAYPKKLFYFPRIRISHPLSWMIIFTIYAFIVSLLSINMVSIAYSVQFLLYVVIGTILMRKYGHNFVSTNYRYAHSIFFAIAAIYSVAILISIFCGPIYPHIALSSTHRRWAGITIQQGVGFSEGYNIAGAVVIFFLAACIYMYDRRIWKKWILLSLLLFALLATLSRGAIFSFALALGLVYCLDSVEPLVQRASIKVSVLKNIGFVISALSFLIILIGLGIYSVNKSVLIAILSGFGLGQQHSVVSKDMAARFSLWAWGMDVWASGSLLRMVFGGGFRSSMTVGAAWKDAHNVYITILGDFGVVGLALFLAALFGAFFQYTRLFLTGKAGRIEKFGLMAMLALSIHNMTGPYFYSPICLSLLIFIFAITLQPVAMVNKGKTCYQ